ncbi:MAG TPA: hypothetical protein VN253_01340 [Kofleriaceae bacterium]|nr:hypothetical protein [Kofleriaceae bacterium]
MRRARVRRRAAAVSAVLHPAPWVVLAGAAACLEVHNPDPIECKVTADCQAGEVCEEHICWGNPPAGALAALVSPPSERSGELVSREVLALPISDDGWLDDLRLEDAVSYKGHLQTLCTPPLVCDERGLGASIIVTRRSAFKGGPGFRKVVTVAPGDEVFDIGVPATKEGEPNYIVTVIPDGRDAPGSGTSIAQLVPPLRTELAVPASSSGNILELGGLDLPRIAGAITGGTGDALANYRVVALGRWDPKEPATEVSTVDFTGSTGGYEITLARGLVGTVELVARPSGMQLRPELHLGSIPADRDSLNKLLALPSPIGTELPVEVVLDHKEASGEIARVAGARVAITGTAATGTNASARVIAEGITDASGAVRLKLLDGMAFTSSYKLSVIPAASSPAAALFEKAFTPQPLTVQRLGTRISLVGKVVDADGHDLRDVLVTARPSVRFLWSLEPGPQAFLGAIPAATTTTSNIGEFVVFVDHAFTNVVSQAGTIWGHYDLTFEPAGKSIAPNWTQPDIELPRDAAVDTLPVGIIQRPDGAHVRGVVFDSAGARLQGAEVKLFRVQTDLTVCSEVRFEPQDCPIPALLMGRGASDGNGVVRLSVPR